MAEDDGDGSLLPAVHADLQVQRRWWRASAASGWKEQRTKKVSSFHAEFPLSLFSVCIVSESQGKSAQSEVLKF